MVGGIHRSTPSYEGVLYGGTSEVGDQDGDQQAHQQQGGDGDEDTLSGEVLDEVPHG